MKFFILLSLVALSCAVPQPRKIFHEHFFDFMDVIRDEVVHEISHLLEHYNEFPEFQATMEFLKTSKFKDLVYEMESLPEFKDVMDFLENDNIDIHFFIDSFNEMLENTVLRKSLKACHDLSGTDFSSFVKDSIAVFPKEQLAALFEQKKEEEEEFKTAVENLNSAEWHDIFGKLWDSEEFQKEVQIFLENGVDVHQLLEEVKAVFGQN